MALHHFLERTSFCPSPSPSGMAPPNRRESFEQRSSMFFQLLPQEIRDEIYFYHFSGIRLSFSVKTRPSQNSLALLRTCRRTQCEIGYKWMHYVLFNFATCSDMFHKLSALPLDTVAEIRHVRVCNVPHEKPYFLLDRPVLAVLKQLPCLQLDRLTVLGGDNARTAYRTIEYLVAEGNGWKELHYISKNSVMLSESIRRSTDHEPLRLQPSHWQQVLENRDGALAKPSVTIYKSTKPGLVGLVVHPETRHIFEQTTAEGHDPNDGEYDQDKENERRNELDKEILIVVKRGAGVFYKQRMVHQRDKPFPLSATLTRPEVQREEDVYTHPYEYDWPWRRSRLECVRLSINLLTHTLAGTHTPITTPESNG